MERKRVSEPYYSRSGAARSAGAGESVQISEGETPGRCGNCCREGGRYFGKRHVPLSIPARESGYSEQSHPRIRSEEHTSELQSRGHLVCRLLLEKKYWVLIKNKSS